MDDHGRIMEELTLAKSKLSESQEAFEESLADLDARIQVKETELAQAFLELNQQKLKLRSVQQDHLDENGRLPRSTLSLGDALPPAEGEEPDVVEVGASPVVSATFDLTLNAIADTASHTWRYWQCLCTWGYWQ